MYGLAKDAAKRRVPRAAAASSDFSLMVLCSTAWPRSQASMSVGPAGASSQVLSRRVP
jgi:hypothetical protein